MVSGALDLMVVMPVYNEEACIRQVVAAWRDELTGLGINFVILVLNDGSRDHTALELESFASDPCIEVVNKPNSGHGPTILMGYRQAVQRAEWVFQVDSDDEMSQKHFAGLWERRGYHVALFGYRQSREQSSGRKLISAVSRLAVRMLFGNGVADVNTPYRLIRSDILRQLIASIPDDTFAPNILISGQLAASGLPILNTPVPHEGRKSGAVSIVRWRLWKAAARSLYQTLAFRLNNPAAGKR